MTGKAQLCRTKKIVASKLQKVLSETFLWKLNDLTMKYFNLRIRLRCDQDSRLSQSRSAKLGPGPRVLMRLTEAVIIIDTLRCYNHRKTQIDTIFNTRFTTLLSQGLVLIVLTLG